MWDDARLIVGNRFVRHPDSLLRVFTTGFWDVSSLSTAGSASYWRPLVTLAYVAEWRLFGAAPLGWHLVNLALHLACVALVARWLSRRLGDASPRGALAALLGAALFAMHPTRPESVSWVSGCTDLWATLFALVALEGWDRRDPRGAAFAGAALALAVMAKEAVVAVPLALAVDVVMARGARPTRDEWRRLALAAAPMLAVSVVRLPWVPLPHPPVSPTGPMDLPLRVLSSLGHAVRLALFPVPASVYSAPATFDGRGVATYAPWSVALGALSAVAFAAALLRARRDPRWRPWVSDAAWFVLTVGPALNVVPLRLDTLVAARFLYLPLLGVCALFARGLLALPAARARAGALVAAGLVLTAGALTLEHSAHFVSDDALFTHEREVHPELCVTAQRLAAARAALGRHRDALRLERERFACVARDGAAVDLAQAGHTLAERVAAVTPDADQRTLAALRDFLLAFDPARVGDARLDVPAARVTVPLSAASRAAVWPAMQPFVAVVEARALDLSAAEARLRDAVDRDDRDVAAWRNLLVVLSLEERFADALTTCARALDHAPGDPSMTAVCALAREGLRATSPPPADPFEARLAVAERRLALGARELARRDAEPLHREHPERPEPLRVLARADLADGLVDRARERLRAALPALPPAARASMERWWDAASEGASERAR